MLYDGALNIEIPSGAKLIAYADDLAIVLEDTTEEELVAKENKIIEKVDQRI